jgi:hypothetical protein
MINPRTISAWLLMLAVFAGALPAAADTPAAVLRVVGLDGNEVRITADQWAALPRESLDVIDHGGSPARFEGVSGREVLKLANAPLGKELRGPNLAVFVLAEAADGYRVVYSLAEFDSGFKDATILVADKKDGKALSTEEGPLRIVVPGEKRPGRWARQLISLKIGKAQ